MNNTKHSADCKMVFGRKDVNCARCRELLAGAKPITWHSGSKAFEARRQLVEIRAHSCTKSNCGPVCTFGEW